MAGLWCEDFARYPDTAAMLEGVWAHVGFQWQVSTANPRTGLKSLKLDTFTDVLGGINGSNLIRRIFGAPKTAAGVGYGFWPQRLPNTEAGLQGVKLFGWLDAAGGLAGSVVLGTDGGLVAYQGGGCDATTNAGYTLLSRADPCVQAKTYNQLEGFIDVAAGTLEVRVNNVTRLNVVGANFNTHGRGEVSQIIVGPPLCGSGNNIMGDTYLDDMHAWDTLPGVGPTTFVGNCAVLPRALIEDTAQADFSLVGGIHGYAILSDGSDATYLVGPAVGNRSAFKAAPLPNGVTGIVYQQINYRAMKDAAGDCDLVPRIVTPSSPIAALDGSTSHVTTAEAWYWGIVATDPNSGMPFTPDEVNADLIEFERTL